MNADVQREDAVPTAGPWEVYSMSEDEGWPEHMGWQGSIRSTTDKDADWVATTIYRKADALLMAAAPHMLDVLARFAEGDPCYYDHHGYCQMHSLHERPCPYEQAKALTEQFGRQFHSEATS